MTFITIKLIGILLRQKYTRYRNISKYLSFNILRIYLDNVKRKVRYVRTTKTSFKHIKFKLNIA